MLGSLKFSQNFNGVLFKPLESDLGFLVDKFPELEHSVKSPLFSRHYGKTHLNLLNCFGFAVDQSSSLGRTEKSHVRISVRLTQARSKMN